MVPGHSQLARNLAPANQAGEESETGPTAREAE